MRAGRRRCSDRCVEQFRCQGHAPQGGQGSAPGRLWPCDRGDGTFSMLVGSRLEVLLRLEVRVALLLGFIARPLGRGLSRLGHGLSLRRRHGHGRGPLGVLERTQLFQRILRVLLVSLPFPQVRVLQQGNTM